MRFSLRRIVIVRMMAIAGLTVILAACGANPSDSTIDTAASTASNSPTPTAASLGIDFTASLLDGSPITLGEQLARRPVALWFWAPG